MAAIQLAEHQIKAIEKMHNGCILNGSVGSGKSRTALAYYYILQGGRIDAKKYIKMHNPIDLYIITTAKKRDDCEWEGEMAPFLLSTHQDCNLYKNKVIVDSWNNITKYADVKHSFFIFDEQRVVGKGAWAKTFIKIAKENQWILLSATPGDTWSDYIPVFVANGFFRNKTEFQRNHIIYSSYTKYPKIDRYINEGRLIRLREKILVDMDVDRHTIPHHEYYIADFNKELYRQVSVTRWNIYDNCPIASAGELCYVWRKIVNTDSSRIEKIHEIVSQKRRVIIFYNFDYELDILKNQKYFVNGKEAAVAEWNGHKHQPVPDEQYWVYLVQYTSGCEGWNCIKTDTIIFYSQNYSYKVMIQASGRIDRLNTPYTDLYYYHFVSKAPIDMAIKLALKNKKKFNESRYMNNGYSKQKAIA